MQVRIIQEGKRDFMDLLLLADETESMIDRYLDRGTLFALYDDGLRGVCVVTDEGGGSYEIQNLAVYEQYQRQGCGSYLVRHVCDYYKGKCDTMWVGTGDSPMTVPFYEGCGFVFSHRLKDYFVEHYDMPIMDNGVRLTDKVYFKMEL